MPSIVNPMLASPGDAPLVDPHLVYEPKYDGIRVMAEVRVDGDVRLWSRLGNDKTRQFPEVTAALAAWGRRLADAVVLDGELVALDAQGRPAGFQRLQGRIHRQDQPAARGSRTRATPAEPSATPLAFIVFDVVRAAGHDLRERPLHERRALLERLLASPRRRTPATIRLSEQVAGDGRALYSRALASGWEGLIAKRADSRYQSGKRTRDWHKLKIVHEQEFVIGGWTEPRNARTHFGALLLGVYEHDALVYVGHTGTGFDERELARLMRLLRPLATATCPFDPRPKTNERPHWVRPELVAQIKFTEWTDDAKLRHPVYLGLRDDKRPHEVRREPAGRLHVSARSRLAGAGGRTPQTPAAAGSAATALSADTVKVLVTTLQDLEDARQDATLALGDGRSIAITNLHKVFWPRLGFTKGDLFRYYVQVAPALLPAIADRPLVMKRFPNGIAGKPFYQHRSTDAPAGVRVEPVPSSDGVRPHIIGGDLLTLLYTTQLAAISQDPWFSRVKTPDAADYVALDLDPSDGVPFRQVLSVARAIHDELVSIDAPAFVKTSGASGLHIYLPLPPGTPYEAGLLFCQIIATVVAHKHPKVATIERSVRARGKRVYIDYLQNIMGKTLATAYSARASEYAGVSTPLSWREVHDGVDRESFTIQTLPARLVAEGDLWAGVRTSPGADLSRAAKYGM